MRCPHRSHGAALRETVLDAGGMPVRALFSQGILVLRLCGRVHGSFCVSMPAHPGKTQGQSMPAKIRDSACHRPTKARIAGLCHECSPSPALPLPQDEVSWGRCLSLLSCLSPRRSCAPTEIPPGSRRGVWPIIWNKPQARGPHVHPAHHKTSLVPPHDRDLTWRTEGSVANLRKQALSQGPLWPPCISQTLSVGRRLGDQGLTIELTMGREWMSVSCTLTELSPGTRGEFGPSLGTGLEPGALMSTQCITNPL
ncbi:uncharacterized protein LOC132668827 [Panthera onca]